MVRDKDKKNTPPPLRYPPSDGWFLAPDMQPSEISFQSAFPSNSLPTPPLSPKAGFYRRGFLAEIKRHVSVVRHQTPLAEVITPLCRRKGGLRNRDVAKGCFRDGNEWARLINRRLGLAVEMSPKNFSFHFLLMLSSY